MMTWIFLSINHPPDQPGVERLAALTGSVPIIIISGLLLPLSFAFSILRYRLWDIDILIRRTISYAILTGLFLVVYFGLVIGAQNILGITTGEQSQALVVVSTLVIAALFNPLRVRVQNFIDRRFYRAKYDAAQTLARFAQTARDEVDMDILSAALLGVVDETMQPDHFAIWLKGDEK
jgi:hypothetical protein